MNKGKILVLSGPSGVGKGTVVKELLEKEKSCVVSVSATTRAARQGEIDGVHYFFITKEEFESKIEKGEMLEYTRYNNYYYGTIKSHVQSFLDDGKNVILEIEVDGATQIKKKCPEAITVFLTAPSEDEVERRLRKRNTEDEETIKKRLEIAKGEMKMAKHYDFSVVNDSIENAVNELIKIIKS